MKKILPIAAFIMLGAGLIGLGSWYDGNISKQSQLAAMDEGRAALDAQSKVMQNLVMKDVVVGAGAEAKNGDAATVNYVGTLDNGTKFDSSYDRKQPFTFLLGAGQVIKGWDMGVLGMKVGGKRELTIPPELGYGAGGAGPIPANSTLHFTVELLSVGNPASGK